MVKVYICTEGEYSDYHIAGVFATREAAEAFIEVEPTANIEEWEAYAHLPERLRYHVIERTRWDGSTRRYQQIRWPWDGPMFEGRKRKAWNFLRWTYGERAWGTDEAAVEKVWKEQHAAEEALEAGV